MDRVALLKEFLTANPGDSFARYGLAMEYSKSGDTATALAEFKKLLELNPDYTPAYQMAGQILVKSGRHDEARAMLKSGMASAERTGNLHAREEMQGMLEQLG